MIKTKANKVKYSYYFQCIAFMVVGLNSPTISTLAIIVLSFFFVRKMSSAEYYLFMVSFAYFFYTYMMMAFHDFLNIRDSIISIYGFSFFYLVGCNILKDGDDNKVIAMFGSLFIGMALYLTLSYTNSDAEDILLRKVVSIHTDIAVNSTAIAAISSNIFLILPFIYFPNKNKLSVFIITLGIALMLFVLSVNSTLGNRGTYLIFLQVALVCIGISRIKTKYKLGIIVSFLVLGFYLYGVFLNEIQESVIFKRIDEQGLETTRIDFYSADKIVGLFTESFFGGKIISTRLIPGSDKYFHNAILDTFDVAGFLSFILLSFIFIHSTKNALFILISRKIPTHLRALSLSLFLACISIALTEPVLEISLGAFAMFFLSYGFQNNLLSTHKVKLRKGRRYIPLSIMHLK